MASVSISKVELMSILYHKKSTMKRSFLSQYLGRLNSRLQLSGMLSRHGRPPKYVTPHVTAL